MHTPISGAGVNRYTKHRFPLPLPCAVFSCGQFNTVRLPNACQTQEHLRPTGRAWHMTEQRKRTSAWLVEVLFYIEMWLSALIFMLLQIFDHHFDDQIRDRALFFFCLYFDSPFQLF